MTEAPQQETRDPEELAALVQIGHRELVPIFSVQVL